MLGKFVREYFDSFKVLHMPVANPVCNGSVPKLPIPPKSQKIPGARNKSNTGTCLAFLRGAGENQRVLRTSQLQVKKVL